MTREELFDKHLRGEISGGEAAELKRLLARDPEAGRAFVEHVNETTLFVRVGTQLQSARLADNVVPLVTQTESRKVRRRLVWKWAALAACFAAVAVLAFSLIHKPTPPRPRDVYVTGAGLKVTRGAVSLEGDGIELQAGDIIATSTNDIAVIAYERESTCIEVYPGSVVCFEQAGPGKRFELRRGIIQARVAPQPSDQPMCVKTAQARATVVGTEFVMRADERMTKLDVIEGKVQLACRASGKKVTVKAGFSAVSNPKAPFSVVPLCSSNCILRECRGTNTVLRPSISKRTNEN